MDRAQSNVAMIMSQVQKYIKLNPLAADTAIGISQYWLSDDTKPTPVSDLIIALEMMEEKGEISSFQNLDGTRIWRKSALKD